RRSDRGGTRSPRGAGRGARVTRWRDERGQALVLLAGVAVTVLLLAGALGAFGKALLGRGRLQRAADLAAVSAARSMRHDFPPLFERGDGRLSKDAYLDRAG